MPPKVAAALLWAILVCFVGLLIAMTWHPWVVGSTAGCAPGTARAWDGRCYAEKKR
jgi:hypothetical protein